MLYKNIGYRLGCHEDIPGVILLPSGVNIAFMANRINEGQLDGKELLLDPQLYLTQLDRATDEEDDSKNITCARLTTYPWYSEVNEYDTNQMQNRTEWFKEHKENYDWPVQLPENESEIKEKVVSCLDFQRMIGVSKYILPVTLIRNAEDQFTEQLKWIKVGLELKEEYNDKPFIASLPFDDSILLQSEFEDNNILQTVIDNISTMNNLDGIYVVVIRNRYDAFYDISPEITYSLLELSYLIGEKAHKDVIINFEDVFGLVCMGVGADSFATGYSTTKRRMSYDNFKTTFGKAYPKFYSQKLIGDFLSESDLNKIKNNNLLSILEDDKTDLSNNLFQALKNDKSASQVPDWREEQNNIGIAEKHRMLRIFNAVSEIDFSSRSLSERVDFVKQWLLSADIFRTYFSERFEDDPLSDDSRHVRVWRNVFDNFLGKYDL